MDNLFSNSEELNEVLDMAKNLPNASGEDEIFRVTGILGVNEFGGFTVTNVSHSVVDILSMIAENKTVFLDVDINIVSAGQTLSVPITISSQDNSLLIFDITTDLDGVSFIRGVGQNFGDSDSWSVTITPLAVPEAIKQPFVVTCIADMQNMVYTNVSHTFEEIKEAYLRGDHIFVIADISQMHSGRYSVAPLTSYGDNYMLFEYVSISGNKSYLVTGFLYSDNSNSFRMTELVSQTQLQEQLGGITLKISSSTPTTDDQSVATFVVRE